MVDQKNIILPPLHIKIGQMKQFLKAFDRSGDCFEYICQPFLALAMRRKKQRYLIGFRSERCSGTNIS